MHSILHEKHLMQLSTFMKIDSTWKMKNIFTFKTIKKTCATNISSIPLSMKDIFKEEKNDKLTILQASIKLKS